MEYNWDSNTESSTHYCIILPFNTLKKILTVKLKIVFFLLWNHSFIYIFDDMPFKQV